MEKIEVEKSYYPNGKLKSERSYKNGIPHGLHREWYENGILASEHVFKEFVTEISRFWDEQGNLLIENNIVNGTGIEITWDPVNELRSEVNWLNGKWTGRFRTYWSDGTICGDIYWIKNRKVSKKKYMEMCKVDKSLPQYDDLKESEKISKKSRKKKASKGKKTATSNDDKFYENLFSEKEMVEALSWLTESNVPERSLGECQNQEDSVEFVNEFYKVGAVRVWVFDIDGKPDEEQNSGRLIIELPKNSQKRKKLLDKCGEIGEELGFELEPDTGQKYTLLMLD